MNTKTYRLRCGNREKFIEADASDPSIKEILGRESKMFVREIGSKPSLDKTHERVEISVFEIASVRLAVTPCGSYEIRLKQSKMTQERYKELLGHLLISLPPEFHSYVVKSIRGSDFETMLKSAEKIIRDLSGPASEFKSNLLKFCGD